MFWNQHEIENAASRRHACPNVRKGLRLLLRLMHSVNEQSDGWAYWPAPSRASEKLQALLETAGNVQHGTHGTISDAALKKAIAPIRAMVTHQKKVQAERGNKFDFDVDAALLEDSPFVMVSVEICVDRRMIVGQTPQQAVQHWIENETKWPQSFQNIRTAGA